MTTPDPSPQTPSHGQSEQCMLYLFGELDADQAAAFEQQLRSSPQLADELMRQSEVIAGLSQSVSTTPVVASAPSPVPVLASVLAIATCIVLIVLGVRPSLQERDGMASLPNSAQQPSVPSEDLLIARAWAASHFDLFAEDAGTIDLEFDDPLALASEDTADVDTTLSWMFIGISANIDEHSAGATNDG